MAPEAQPPDQLGYGFNLGLEPVLQFALPQGGAAQTWTFLGKASVFSAVPAEYQDLREVFNKVHIPPHQSYD
jgi:hypothetical protein